MRVYINKSGIVANLFIYGNFGALFVALCLKNILFNDMNYVEWALWLTFLLSWYFLTKSATKTFTAIKISQKAVTSALFFKKHCAVFFDRPVYVSFFSELYFWVDKYTPHDYVMVSNSPIPDFEPNTRFETYNRAKQIIFPDTEKTRQAIAPLLASEFCILQGDDPPPVESLRKKKKEETPVVKQEKSTDDPPPFTGKWNGRF